jgi:hypothetical protein
MKLVIAWLALVGLAAIVATSCSVSHRSGEFTCNSSADCVGEAAGRICSGGFCVVPGAGIDAPMLHDAPKITFDASIPDADACPAQCTSCDLGQMTCNIVCTNASQNCANTVTCPAGFHCTIGCTPGNACKDVDCLDAASCNVTCSGSGSCRQVSCGPTPCDVSCTGQSSCRGVACGLSCACDVTCGDLASCENVFCSHQVCDGPIGAGCSSQLDPICNTCQ